jgi:hypothetical protein
MNVSITESRDINEIYQLLNSPEMGQLLRMTINNVSFPGLDCEIKLGKMALNIKDPELTMVVEDEHRFLIPNSFSGPQILQNTGS